MTANRRKEGDGQWSTSRYEKAAKLDRVIQTKKAQTTRRKKKKS